MRSADCPQADLEGKGLEPLHKELGITSIPTFVVFKDGVVKKQFAGLNFPAIKAAIEELGGEMELTPEAESPPGGCIVM
jgi:thiol-disulfide isomerase/thioredoxin